MIDLNAIDANTIHSAISTWSGFVYQGKVAIYHSIRLLIEEKKAIDYFLQLDSLEDFAITDKDRIISLHQVKAKSSDYYSTYKEDFIKLIARKVSFPAEQIFFHLAVENEKGSAYIEIIHSPLLIYRYHNGLPFCELTDIDKHINCLISRWLLLKGKPEQNNIQTIELIRNCLEEKILKQVIEIHAANHTGAVTINEGAFYLTIPLREIIEILDRDMANWATSEAYYCHLLRSDLNLYFQEFLLELESDGPLEEITKKHLSKYLVHMSNLDTEHLVKFIKTILPHRIVKFETIADYKNVGIREDEFKDALFRALSEITKEAEMGPNNINWTTPLSEKLVPTLINASGSSTIQTKRICSQIHKNVVQTDLEVAFENQRMITSELDVSSIFEQQNHFMQNLPEAYEHDEDQRITNWRTVSLISIETAKGLLND